MPERTSAIRLLHNAATIYDGDAELRDAARTHAWRRGFRSGAQWMALAMTRCRDQEPAVVAVHNFQRLGLAKYVLASAAAIVFVFVAILTRSSYLLLLAPLAFYVVEAQLMFLFPLALDGSRTPFRDSLHYTRRAGGAIRATATVTTLAVVMLFGGFAGRGFVRCWCLGCLAVCLWYDAVARQPFHLAPETA